MKQLKLYVSVIMIIGLISGCDLQKNSNPLDDQLYSAAEHAGADNLERDITKDTNKVELGRMLFFDKLLSGNKDISCATCHHPTLNTGDALSLSIGVGGSGLGKDRVMGHERERIPRNATEIYNRGVNGWHTMFWDSRVPGTTETGFTSPAGSDLPDGLESNLAVQAMFPVTSRDEMRGAKGDRDVNGKKNELAVIPDSDLPIIWNALMQRLLDIPEYVVLFNAAYPNLSKEELGFEHAANAIAAFETKAFTLIKSPWDRYLRGDETALPATAKRGALLFYGEAQCSTCHSGKLMTDQEHHNIGIPQLGPGKGDEAPLDLGRFRVTGDEDERYAFRTPPLRNVELTGPWMHNGAYSDLEQAIKHHLDPVTAIEEYDLSQLEQSLQPTVLIDDNIREDIINSLDPMVSHSVELSDEEVNELMAFMRTLTDPDAAAGSLSKHIPNSVPSGLPVED
ncbi:MAG TPA: cytochrome c peroxidase [Fodinibius sp.]|nr:cytochrome c peroxidase [Fodinibius sp.]